jgi:regulatory protein
MQQKEMTEQQALSRLAAECSKAEHCSGEMLEKMYRWGLSEEAQARIMAYLTDHQYIDDERFTHSFVSDKIKYNKWGRRKIEQALYQKRIPEDIAAAVLDTVPDSDYVAILKPLLLNKQKSVSAQTDYERWMKLFKFAIGRGFSPDIIKQCLKEED